MLIMRIRLLGSMLAFAGGLLAAAQSQALSFTCISNNDPTQCAIGEAQFSASLSDLGGGQVGITFSNSGPEASIIADVYIDDGASVFTGIASITDGTGTDFESGADPADLPGGNTVSPTFVADFSADAEPPTGTNGNGADPGESFTLVMNLAGGVTFADVQAAIADGSLRLGIHGQGLGTSGGSESFVNGGGENAVPEPTAALIFGAGLLVVSRRARRR
jgi:hypothetical protein